MRITGALTRRRIRFDAVLLAAALLLMEVARPTAALNNRSVPPPPSSSSLSQDGGPLSINRRNLFWQVPVASVASYSYGKLAYNSFSVQGIKYPEAHESRVIKTISTALSLAAASTTGRDKETFRVLEVGVGTDCRLARRGLYSPAIRQLALEQPDIKHLDFVGIDLETPKKTKVIDEAKQQLVGAAGASSSPLDVDLEFVERSISEKTSFMSGYFDSIICCFTLCSVDDPVLAVEEMKRLLRPDGGTLGFIEHVAVNDDESYRVLNWEQKKLDRAQQLVAHNCHLHRPTDQTLVQVMGATDSTEASASLLEGSERFLVDNMWPVSMQSCGVIQRRIA